jgi:cytochrome c oxidase cbb3-type subunit III
MNKMKPQLLWVVCLWIGLFIPLSAPAQAQEEPPMLNALLRGGTIEQATESVIRAINSHNYSFVRQQAIDSRLVPQGWEAKSVRIIYFCNFDTMSKALALDTRASAFIPCRITLIETRDGVELTAVNPAWISLRMGNYRLHEYCLKLKVDYQAIMDEATL